MSIAAATHSYYNPSPIGGNASLATSPLASSPGGRIAAIVDALTRVLQASNTSTNATSNAGPSANSSAAIILTQLSALAKVSDFAKLSDPAKLSALVMEFFSTNPMGSINGAALQGVAMELNLNHLLNSSVLQKALAQLPPELLSKPQVIQALVLQNTLLPASTNKEQLALPTLLFPTPNGASPNSNGANPTNTLYRVNIEWQNKLIQLLSPQPLPTGTRVPLQIDAHGAITLLRPEIAAKLLLAQNVANSAPTANVSPSLPTAPIATSPATLTPAQTIQQSLRELLPRQQALHTLVPLLQKFIAPASREQLPQPITKALAQLLQSLPKSTQLNTAENVKQAISNSGSFLEAKIANVATAAPNAEPLPKIAATDIKAQITTLLALIRHVNPQAAAMTTKTSSPPTTTSFVAEDDFVYAKPVIQNLVGDSNQTGESESLDALLTQLGKLLQSGFARIQLNQLDSAHARHVNNETQTPVPTWVLELPLRTQHGVDQLQLRIEQHRKQQQQRTRVQWNVEIAFDLHAAGKIAASLAIVDNSVSATLWAEQEKTHLRVRQEMDFLRVGLESVGVKVTEMQCRLGLPTPRANPISQQLVDVHT